MGFKVIDNFLEDWSAFRAHCDQLTYSDIENPLDNVVYPGISVDIPDEVERETICKVSEAVGSGIVSKLMFLRLTSGDMNCPHQAHTDVSMGQFSLMLYMNRLEDCLGGTSIVIHEESGMYETPINERQLNIWKEDHSRPEKWQILNICAMKPNRAFIFDANLMHRAEPVGGFGESAANGRLVLTMFFDYDSES